MTGHDEVRIPAKRLHLLWVFCLSLLGLLVFYLELRAIFVSFGRQEPFYLLAYMSLLATCCIISIPHFVLFALWAFVRLVLNLPALILTPEGIVNHSIVYHVVIPWHEINELARDVTPTPPSSSPLMRRREKLADADILVLGHDQRRLYERQQPLTRALLWLFKSLRPINLNTEVMAETTEEVWAQLEHYVRQTLGNTSIKLTTDGAKSSNKS